MRFNPKNSKKVSIDPNQYPSAHPLEEKSELKGIPSKETYKPVKMPEDYFEKRIYKPIQMLENYTPESNFIPQKTPDNDMVKPNYVPKKAPESYTIGKKFIPKNAPETFTLGNKFIPQKAPQTLTSQKMSNLDKLLKELHVEVNFQNCKEVLKENLDKITELAMKEKQKILKIIQNKDITKEQT